MANQLDGLKSQEVTKVLAGKSGREGSQKIREVTSQASVEQFAGNKAKEKKGGKY